MELVSRAKAQRLGLYSFFTGKPCRHGHISERNTKFGYCYICQKEQSSKYQKENKDSIKAASKEYREKNKEYFQEYLKQYFIDNIEKYEQYARDYYENNSERVKERSKQYARENPQVAQAARQRRRARARNAEGTHSAEDILKMVHDQDNFCNYCGVSFETVPYQIDHIIPLSKGGSNWPDNLQLLCGRCNSKKRAKLPEELDESFFASLSLKD
jgi:5-methylcytosine-specific restriction endonuclease McrA